MLAAVFLHLLLMTLTAFTAIDGYFNAQQMDTVQETVDKLCLDLRKIASQYRWSIWVKQLLTISAPGDVVPVVDAFAFSDHLVNSPLGSYDGRIYEAYFDQVS
jgi:acyl-CoA oxidase